MMTLIKNVIMPRRICRKNSSLARRCKRRLRRVIFMTATQNQCYKVYTSLGIGVALLPFLDDLEQLTIQSLNKFCYKSAVARVQTKLQLSIPCLFTLCTELKLSQTVLTYDGSLAKPGRMTFDGSLIDFKKLFTVQVKYNLYGFKNFYAEVCLISL